MAYCLFLCLLRWSTWATMLTNKRLHLGFFLRKLFRMTAQINQWLGSMLREQKQKWSIWVFTFGWVVRILLAVVALFTITFDLVTSSEGDSRGTLLSFAGSANVKKCFCCWTSYFQRIDLAQIILENRSRKMESGSEVYTVVSNQQGEECEKRVYCVMYIRHTWLRNHLADFRKC